MTNNVFYLNHMGYLILSFIFFFSGCASVQTSGYISRVEHPYKRKIYADFEKVISAFIYVFKNQGWTIVDEIDPSVYERDDRYDNNGFQNVLIIADARRNFRVLYWTSTHLNAFIHCFGNTCDLEIRTSSRNDRQGKSIFDAVMREINRT